jgi:3-oxoacyl-[acyl-carrier-protein] synthase-3
MNGGVVIMQASRKIPSSVSVLLERNRISAESVGAFLTHQANKNLIVRVAQSLGVPPNKFFSNVERYGNTSSASMLIAAAEWEAEFGFRDGVPIVFSAFGAGFHWGSVLAIGVR